MTNPFIIGIAKDTDFCDREKELKELRRYAVNGQNVVFYSPRRYGKSSLIKMLLDQLKPEGFLTVYVDLFSVSSQQDFVAKLATGITEGIGRTGPFKDTLKNVFTKFIPSLEITPEGMRVSVKFDKTIKFQALLEDVLKGMYAFTEKNKNKTCIALDEFQEITGLENAKEIEGTLRSHIQSHKNAAFFFIGSRRQILKDIFTDKNRPFYKSAFQYELPKIPQQDFVRYIIEKFQYTQKDCSPAIATKIWIKTQGYPYYVQKLAYLLWDSTETICDETLLQKAWDKLIQQESRDFEGIWAGLPTGQKTFLKSLAKEPTSMPFSKEYLEKYNLSAGGVQNATAALIAKDLIEKDQDGTYKLVDPIMSQWLEPL